MLITVTGGPFAYTSAIRSGASTEGITIDPGFMVTVKIDPTAADQNIITHALEAENGGTITLEKIIIDDQFIAGAWAYQP